MILMYINIMLPYYNIIKISQSKNFLPHVAAIILQRILGNPTNLNPIMVVKYA